jgi:hypothetical protein
MVKSLKTGGAALPAAIGKGGPASGTNGGPSGPSVPSMPPPPPAVPPPEPIAVMPSAQLPVPQTTI